MALRPDLNGQRLRNPANGAIYLIDRGQKRHVDDPTAMTNLFNDWSTIPDLDVNLIDDGPDIDDLVVLSQGFGNAAVYLIDKKDANGTRIKRHIQNPGTMTKYNFSWNKVYHVPLGLIEGTPTGLEIV
jgi:hypothetical protein